MKEILQHASAITIAGAIFFMGFYWGKMWDQTRSLRERRRIWREEQSKLPRAIKPKS